MTYDYMKKKYISIILSATFVALAFFPSISNAALVPCGKSTDTGNDQMCTLCHLIIGIKGLVDYGFTIMVIVGLAMLVIAGVVYIVSAGNEGMMETAKSLMKNVLIGFALILGAWLIVTTMMWIMGTRETGDEGGVLGIKVTSWNTFTCSTSRPSTTNTTNDNTNTGIQNGTGGGGQFNGNGASGGW